ncbi:SDR family NAD(P)-dependent oxidoreductase [Vibrio nigripulchritudo]|uniref:SDR family NAD(P)-dependent oxidoreductase n=1 Tax=Vibrio nigripulchritudo TaxID=28173 RepID=UPI002490576F|nr:SDR family NAD(P)-dependent oxidoreductase [Vibrio nigripulchritudo]BDU37685.1 3-ketoacyl-ACP reductase [Vibrio nigripulchritudo]BDU43405.1 3-ketoacyl-ACP reductase [Vibrio nigripulchritudo]
MKTVLITGAGKGIGAAIAEHFAQKDFAVYLNVRTLTPEVEAKVAKLQANGAVIIPLVFDINNPEQTEKALASINHLDVLVNNAGILRDNLIPQISQEDWQAVISTNFHAAQAMFHQCVPLMEKSASPCIINLGSISGVRPRAGQGAYAVAKAMIIEWTKQLGLQPPASLPNLVSYAISPGPVATEMIKQAPWYKQKGAFDRIPLKRFAEPEEVAQLAFTLATQRPFKSGDNLVLDGGFIQTTKTA